MITISVGQALLILLDEKEPSDYYNLIKRLYLTGPNDKKEINFLDSLLKNPKLSKYNISRDAKVINDDPSRRYFETHLAYNTLRLEIKKIDSSDLKATIYSSLKHTNNACAQRFHEIFNLNQVYRDGLSYEMLDAISSIQKHKHFQIFSTRNKLKLEQLAQMTYLGVKAINTTDLPLKIAYDSNNKKSYYHNKNRGRIDKGEENAKVTTSNFGLLKGHMPIPHDDIAFRGNPYNYLKCSERNTFIPEAKWNKENFKKLVHPFSCSISGTLLALLRLLAHLQNKKCLVFQNKQKMAPFLNSLISLLIYNSGGHTFREFYSVLEIEAIKQGFSFIKNFDDICLLSLMKGENKAAFDKALHDTIIYNKTLLIKSKLHEEIHTVIPRAKPVEFKKHKQSRPAEEKSMDILGLFAKHKYRKKLQEEESNPINNCNIM